MSIKTRLDSALVATVFGFVLSRIGFGAWDEVHRMFTLTSLRLIATFAGAVLLLMAAWAVIARLSRPQWTPRPLHPGSLPGGLLFGIGWAICGACPSIAFVQLGEGQLFALCSLVGMLLGNLLFGLGQGRIFRFSTGGSCQSDD